MTPPYIVSDVNIGYGQQFTALPTLYSEQQYT
jgi:hypothetical protein